MGPMMGGPATEIQFFGASSSVPVFLGSRRVSGDAFRKYLQGFWGALDLVFTVVLTVQLYLLHFPFSVFALGSLLPSYTFRRCPWYLSLVLELNAAKAQVLASVCISSAGFLQRHEQHFAALLRIFSALQGTCFIIVSAFTLAHRIRLSKGTCKNHFIHLESAFQRDRVNLRSS